MASSIHDIETRKGSAWLKRAMEHLGRSMNDENSRDTQHAISILISAREDCHQ